MSHILNLDQAKKLVGSMVTKHKLMTGNLLADEVIENYIELLIADHPMEVMAGHLNHLSAKELATVLVVVRAEGARVEKAKAKSKSKVKAKSKSKSKSKSKAKAK